MSPEDGNVLDLTAAQILGMDEDLYDSPYGLQRFDYMPAYTLGLAERYVDIIEHKETTP